MMGEELSEAESLIHRLKMKEIEAYRETHPILGQFSPEQYEGQTQENMGVVYLPTWKKGGMPFTNMKSRHFKSFFKAYILAEGENASREKRPVDINKILAYGEWLLANLNGWLSEQYLKTGLAALQPPEPSPTMWKKMKMKITRR